MTDVPSSSESIAKRVPWNQGKIVGAKPPLRPKLVWSIRTKLQVEGRIRELLKFVRAARAGIRDLRPRDMIDMQSFLWVQGSDEYPD